MQLLVRNVIVDFERWLELWRNAEDPNEIFFLFDVEDRDRAVAFMSTPEAAAAGERAGATEGEYWFVEGVSA